MIPYAGNTNKSTERGSGLIEHSLREYGAGRSVVVDRNNVLVCGHQTQAGAVNAGIRRVITVDTTGNELVCVRRLDLDLTTDPRAHALAIADNSAAIRSIEFDPILLVKEAKDYQLDLNELGISEEELQAMIEKASIEEDEPAPEPKSKQVTCPCCGHVFDPKAKNRK